MSFLTVIVALLLSFFSTAVMGYISMATPLGPWIETTLVLSGMLILFLFKNILSSHVRARSLGLATAAGGIGGILATACGFSFPTLFFIDHATFCSLKSNPLSFMGLLTSLALAAGSLGLVCASVFDHILIERDKLAFPIGELVYKMISIQENIGKAFSLALGFVGTQMFLFLRAKTNFIPAAFSLMKKVSWTITSLPALTIQTDLLPMYWAIGFVTGHVIALPLFLGFLATIFVIHPLYYVYPSVAAFFSYPTTVHSYSDFLMPFCSGMVLYGALIGFLELPKLARSVIATIKKEKKTAVQIEIPWVMAGLTLLFNGAFLWMTNFSILGILYLVAFTLVCTYQMAVIAGKMGLAPLGRFATFVMVPGMFLFGYTPLQTTLVATYVEIAGGVACDALFGKKMGSLLSLNKKSVAWYQLFGLVISALCVGAVLLVYMSHFGIGNEAGALPVTKAVSRALLINVKSFDPLVLALGMLFGYLLKCAKVNATLLLGGILMPPEISLILILGGWSTYLVKDREEYYPFWSGVFAANSLWMLIRAFF